MESLNARIYQDIKTPNQKGQKNQRGESREDRLDEAVVIMGSRDVQHKHIYIQHQVPDIDNLRCLVGAK